MVEVNIKKQASKDTNFGELPLEWLVYNIGEVSSKIGSGITPRGGERVYKKYGVPFIRSQNIRVGFLSLDEVAFIDSETHDTFKGTELKIKDVLLNITGASIGRSALVDDRIAGGNVNQHVCIIRPEKTKMNPEYLCQYLNSRLGQKVIQSFQAGGNREGLNFAQIASIKIPIPKSSEEQKAIATALTDMDDLILSLEKLISKKKMIKEGAMEELLNGKKRLVGFNDRWIDYRIDKIGKSYSGLSGKKKDHFNKGNAFYIPFMNVMSNPIIDITYFEHVVIKEGEIQNRVKKGDLLFNTSSETPEEVGMCSVLKRDVDNLYLNSFCFGFRLNNLREINPLFLSYLFRSKIGRTKMSSLAQGSTRYNLSKSNFNKLTIKLPKYNEQEAIANILSDMDIEIEKLEKKLNKYKNIKAGMMEELLTGKRRLV